MNLSKKQGLLAATTLQAIFKAKPTIKNDLSGNTQSVSLVVNREINRDDIYQLELTELNYTMKRSGTGVSVKIQNKENE